MLTESMLLLRLKPHPRKLQNFTNQHVTKQEAELLKLYLKQFFVFFLFFFFVLFFFVFS